MSARRAQTWSGGRPPPPPPFLETQNQLTPLPEMPRIFSFRLQCAQRRDRLFSGAAPPGSVLPRHDDAQPCTHHHQRRPIDGASSRAL